MLSFATITPHPPLIIPTIGKPEDIKLVSSTIKEMTKLADVFSMAKVENLIIISPHGPLQFDQFTINKALSFKGDFQNFGDFETELIFRNNQKLVVEIEKDVKKEKIPIKTIELTNIDHGALVPLYFLSKSKLEFRLIPLYFSFLDFKTHYKVGEIIGSIVKNEKSRVGIVASGDLSHRLLPDAPGGYSPEGKKFDKKLIDLIEKKDIKGILNFKPDFVEAAGECGFRSILILLGALQGLNWKPEILSYEGPFGVGYMVVNFKIN
jgi:aromatic ring-opening dioxygenase LigB subunit